MLAVYGIVLAIFLTGGTKEISCVYIKNLYVVWWLSIVVGMACNLSSLWPRDFEIPPKIDAFREEYIDKMSPIKRINNLGRAGFLFSFAVC